MANKKKTVKSIKTITSKIITDVILNFWNKVFEPWKVYDVSNEELLELKKTSAFKKGKISIV